MGIFDEIAENKIKETHENDRSDNPEGIGEHIDNTDYLSIADNYRVPYHIIKNSKILPEENELKKKIQSINTLIREKLSPDKRDALYSERAALLAKLDLLLEMHIKNKY